MQVINRFAVFDKSESFLTKISSEKQFYDEFHFRRRYISVLQQVASEWSKTKLSEEKCFKIKFSEPNFNLKKMNESYSTETVSYFTQQGLEDKQVYAINGLIYNADLSFYNSSKQLDFETGDGEMIVMDRLGNMFIAPKKRGIFHHSSFFSGRPVAFAALCFIKHGKIQELLRYSGHYLPSEQEECAFTKQLQTNYLVEERACSDLKIDSKGCLIQRISILSKEKVEDLYNAIAELGGFCRSRLHLISGDKVVPSAKLVDKQFVDMTIAESNLKNHCIIYADEFTYTPYHRIYPISKFELIIND